MVQRFAESDSSLSEYVLGRHARAEHNVREGTATFAGGRVDSELTEEGIAEIDSVIEKIVADSGCDIIVCSTMKRSDQTAKIIADGIEEKLGERPKVKTIDDLQEIDVGEFTGNTGKWAIENYPDEANEFYHGDIHKWRFPGGESYSDATLRVQSVLKQLAEIAKPGEKVIIIGHGMFDRVFLSLIFPDRQELWQPTDFPHDRLIAFNPPGEIIVK